MSLVCHLSDENFGLFPLLFELIYTVTAAKDGASSTFLAGLNNTDQRKHVLNMSSLVRVLVTA